MEPRRSEDTVLPPLHIYHWTLIHMLALHEVEHKCDRKDATEHDDGVVHALRRYRGRDRKADPYHSEAAVQKRKAIDWQTQLAQRPSGLWQFLATKAL